MEKIQKSFDRDEHIRLCFLHAENGTCDDCLQREEEGCEAFPEKGDEPFDVAVIVGRFHVDELTDGHKDLFTKVTKEHKRVIVFLGLSPCKSTIRNPLDFEARKLMINELYPDIDVYYIHDQRDDVLWSDTLDGMVMERVDKTESVCLYGGRDSFINSYSGKYICYELLQKIFTSGTERRKQIAMTAEKNQSYRQGAISTVANQWPACLPTVDMAIFNDGRTRILLAKKPKESSFRFPGGFVEPGATLEGTVISETLQETHLVASRLSYVKSFVINDWRYRSEVNKITTSLFIVDQWTGTPEPDDDICELRWFPFNTHTLDSVITEHREMLDYLLKEQ